VAEAWKLGREGVDDGALLLVAVEDRRVRIEVGYGLEGVLPDATANRIIDDEIVPRFRAGDYYGGITAGVDRMLRVIEGEPLPEPERRSPAMSVPGLFELLPFLFVFVLVGGFDPAPSVRPRRRRAGHRRTGRRAHLGAGRHPRARARAGVVAFIFALLGGFGGFGGGPGRGGWYSRRHGSGWGHPGGSVADSRAGRWLWRRLERRRWRLRRRWRVGELVNDGLVTVVQAHVRDAQRRGRAFPPEALGRIEAAVDASERLHAARSAVAVEGRTRAGRSCTRQVAARARPRGVAALGVWDTEANNGVLIYVLLADRDVEIVADRGFNGRVSAAQWPQCARICSAIFGLVAMRGVVAGVEEVGRIIGAHYPQRPGQRDEDELPNRPALL